MNNVLVCLKYGLEHTYTKTLFIQNSNVIRYPFFLFAKSGYLIPKTRVWPIPIQCSSFQTKENVPPLPPLPSLSHPGWPSQEQASTRHQPFHGNPHAASHSKPTHFLIQ